jgi:hypothetical protein
MSSPLTVGARDAAGRISIWRVETTADYDYRRAMFDVLAAITNETKRVPRVVLACLPGGKQ